MGPEEEFVLYDSRNSWPAKFKQIRAEAERKHKFSLKDSCKPEFRNRNRYRDVSPYDHSRVRLQRNGVDYINASLVQAPQAHRSYILTQGPLPETAGHFWLMVWEQDSRAILMLNHIIEKGQVKCHQYYPTGRENEGDDEMEFSNVGLKVTYVCERDTNYHYRTKVLQITDITSSETKEVVQFHYTSWPDFGVPESPCAFLDFLNAVRTSGALDVDVGPPVIHCSAGIGRSGTFCLVDTCLLLIEQSGDPKSINVIDVLMEMRTYRMGLIQTYEQLRFSYLAIVEGIKQMKTLNVTSRDSGIDNSSIEENGLRSPGRTKGGAKLSSSEDEGEEEDDDDEEGDDTDYEKYGTDSPPHTPPPIPPRFNRVIPQPGDTTEDPTETWTRNNDESSLNGEPVVLPSEDRRPDQIDATTNDQRSEVTRRNREERQRKTAELIAAMKQRQRESELWSSRQRRFGPYVIGLSAVAIAAASFLYYRYFKMSA